MSSDLTKEVSNTPSDPLALLKLEPGWDSYDANAISPVTVGRAAAIGQRLADLFSVPPTYVPLSSGDVQIEWHCDGWDVEIAVERFRG